MTGLAGRMRRTWFDGFEFAGDRWTGGHSVLRANPRTTAFGSDCADGATAMKGDEENCPAGRVRWLSFQTDQYTDVYGYDPRVSAAGQHAKNFTTHCLNQKKYEYYAYPDGKDRGVQSGFDSTQRRATS